jgi:4-amino-4-deoxy-L-arabinose transferase-like glycosyltransferase
VIATVVIAAAYDTARAVGERAAILAAVFVICCYPMFYYSRTGNVDVPMLCFIALAVAAFARIRSASRSGARWHSIVRAASR